LDAGAEILLAPWPFYPANIGEVNGFTMDRANAHQLLALHASGKASPDPADRPHPARVRPARDDGGVLTCIGTINAPGFGPPLHRHRETEVFYVLGGRYLFEIDGRRYTADAGDAVIAPGESAYTFANLTDKPARRFIQILPGLDAVAFFLGLGDVMHDGKLDQDALNAFGKQWHVEYLGPPLKADPR
jgi:quercetin dioxygenase-like cupin family protein